MSTAKLFSITYRMYWLVMEDVVRLQMRVCQQEQIANMTTPAHTVHFLNPAQANALVHVADESQSKAMLPRDFLLLRVETL